MTKQRELEGSVAESSFGMVVLARARKSSTLIHCKYIPSRKCNYRLNASGKCHEERCNNYNVAMEIHT